MAQSKIFQKKSPKNVAIIMDGNGRWALKNSLQISQGHKKGVEVVREIVKESLKWNIETLTIYAFSSENWQRPDSEIKALKSLVIEAINAQLSELKEQKVKLKFFGKYDDFGKEVKKKILYAEDETSVENFKLSLNVALGYGGQQDIVDIVKKISKKVLSNKIRIESIDRETIESTSSVPVSSIDLLIRTGGDTRISNFLLFQIAYAEIMFLEKYWPDFTVQDYKECLNNFKKVDRRFGKRI